MDSHRPIQRRYLIYLRPNHNTSNFSRDILTMDIFSVLKKASNFKSAKRSIQQDLSNHKHTIESTK